MNQKQKDQKVADLKNRIQSLRNDLEPLLRSAESLRSRIHDLELDLSIVRDTKIERVKELR